MFLLAIDTSLAACSAAIYDAQSQRVVCAEKLLMERGHAEAIAPMVERVLKKASLRVAQLGAVAVTTGPGTFTGVRIGLSLAQGTAMARRIPLIGIDTMQATAAPLFGGSTPIIVVHRAGATGQVYAQSFDSNGTAMTPIALLKPEDVSIPPQAPIIGTGAALVTQTLLANEEHDLPDAAAFAAHASSLPEASGVLLPIYIREADAKPQTTQPSVRMSRVGSDQAEVLARVHGEGFDASWAASEIATMLESAGAVALLAERGGQPIGMIVLRAISDEAEILTLAVAKQDRRRGIARHLLQSARPYLEALRVRMLHLEVAADNAAALALYDTAGFKRVGLRKNYYSRSGSRVDAILMRKDI
jgi:tRNA threonylcarbamoyl adenosine modification protein YeaZ/ribosomal-protein-alanine acetyltransferase